MLEITADQRRALRARAHALNPVVAISQNGLSAAVLQEIDRSLKSHELIKIRVFSDERSVREEYMSTLCEQLDAAPVQHIGKLLVVWRPSDEKEAAAKKTAPARAKRKEIRRSKRSHQSDRS